MAILKKDAMGFVESYRITWRVLNKYEIIERREAPLIIGIGGIKREYKPLIDTPNLFMEYLQLLDGGISYDEKKWRILEWVKRYGLPISGELPAGYIIEEEIKQNTKNNTLEKHISEQDFSISTIIKSIMNMNEVFHFCYETINKSSFDESNQSIKAVMEIINKRFQDQLSQIVPTIFYTEDNEIGTYKAVPNLLTAMWLQLYIYITDISELKTCAYCSRQFLPTRSRQSERFCPKASYEGRSSCENRFNTYKSRNRANIKNLYAQGKSIDEISTSLNIKRRIISEVIEEQ